MDIAWLGLERHGPAQWSFDLTPPLTRFDGKLYGGTGIAVTTATMEAETGGGALWATVQFAGSADLGERIDCHVEVLARGRRTSQVRMTATVGDRTVLAAIGATGEARTDRVTAQFDSMPVVAPPDASPEWRPNLPIPIPRDVPSWLSIAELRHAALPDGRQGLWARMRSMAQTRATLGFLADMVPSSVATAAGRAGGGTSLDNSMRFGPRPDTEWILVDFDPYLATDGYGHGGARLWSLDGVLLGVASQTAMLLLFD
ncbi:MAG TPA: thioesterase family protein [Acidimicrobiales bacterium]|nr:thioesterase family protein [Acidimicrobiales bacterium]